MPGEAYLQMIINELNLVCVRGEENMSRMMKAIQMLKDLRNDVIKHKNPELKSEDAPETM